MSTVLLVNHRQQNCGVQQFGKRLFSYPMQSKKHTCYYIDIDAVHEFNHWAETLNPSIVVYNYYSVATMPWLNHDHLERNRNRFKQLSVFHEVPLVNLSFDLVLHQDPDHYESGYIPLPRPIPEYQYGIPTPTLLARTDHPIFSSFGFGLGGKGFTDLVRITQDEFDNATVRLNIPFAAFGDSAGHGAHTWARACRELITKPGIQLEITHDLMDENKLIDWLAQSTANCFLYAENYGRGISGTTDYALAAGKPIVITKSWQFKHLWSRYPQIVYNGTSLTGVINTNTDYLHALRQEWSAQRMIDTFDHIFDMMG